MTLYRARYLLPCTEDHPVIKDAHLLIQKDKILSVGPWKKRPRLKGRGREVDWSDRLIMPPLANLHTHLPMVMFRGVAEDQDLFTWLNETIFPLEKKKLNPSFVRKATRAALTESIRNGVGFFCDMYLYEDVVADVADAMGVRGVFCQSIIGFPVNDAPRWEDALERARKLIRRYQDHPRIAGGVGPHAVYTCSDELLRQTAELARTENAGGMIHLSETKKENTDSLAEHGCSPLERMNRTGLLNMKHLILAHSVWLEDSDYALLKQPQLTAALNVQCNAKLASGVPPISRLQTEGVRFCLGTDGAASNNNIDMFEEMNFLGKIHHLTTGDLAGLPCREIVDAVTRRPAEAFGLQDSLGTLEPGKQADFISLDLTSPHLNPMSDPYAYLVYSARGADVASMTIAGKRLL
jgi:5-methylthioadenosine/S-adenosylhomocysteine deaminase